MFKFFVEGNPQTDGKLKGGFRKRDTKDKRKAGWRETVKYHGLTGVLFDDDCHRIGHSVKIRYVNDLEKTPGVLITVRRVR